MVIFVEHLFHIFLAQKKWTFLKFTFIAKVIFVLFKWICMQTEYSTVATCLHMHCYIEHVRSSGSKINESEKNYKQISERIISTGTIKTTKMNRIKLKQNYFDLCAVHYTSIWYSIHIIDIVWKENTLLQILKQLHFKCQIECIWFLAFSAQMFQLR